MTQHHSTRLTSRFCHDMANPLGAIGNGLELLSMSGLPPSPELALIEESLTQAKATLQRFRFAFGNATDGDADAQHMAKFQKVFRDSAPRIDLSTPDLNINALQAKLYCLIAMCLENSLPVGGMIDVSKSGDGVLFKATGRLVKFDPDLWTAISAPDQADAEIPPARLHFVIAGMTVQDLGGSVTVQADDDMIEVSVQA
ncbi:MAG: histidine phosphotransferase family protein [Planktomarina sp.]